MEKCKRLGNYVVEMKGADMQEENNVVYGLSEEELEDFTPIVTNVIKEICVFSDKYNFDRNSMLAYLSDTLKAMSEFATIENYEV